jgi:hypothetical protein
MKRGIPLSLASESRFEPFLLFFQMYTAIYGRFCVIAIYERLCFPITYDNTFSRLDVDLREYCSLKKNEMKNSLFFFHFF